jgi:glucose/arabinose dehydrogenase/PKD repeat protein
VKRRGTHRAVWLAALGWGAALCLLPSLAHGATVPSGFEDRLVTTVASPTALAFTPDGRLLVASQTGALHIYKNGALLASPALDLSSRICDESERGLLGIAVDPAFSSNRAIYLYYTFKKSGVCGFDSVTGPVNRVSRFILGDNDLVDLASEVVLIDNIPSTGGNHNAGDLEFGNDGYLYISVGDGGCDYAGDSGCGPNNNASRDQNVLLGKILRVTRFGDVPAGNPFLGPDSARCNLSGRTDPGKKCRETFAWGLRNPFRIAFDPDASATRFFINDVGQSSWEEIDLGQAGADYGWNVREGHCATGSTTNCGAPPAGMTNPIYDYDRTAGCGAITGGAFVPNGLWPTGYDDAYLYGDFVCRKIFVLTPAPGGGYSATEFASGTGGISGLIFGPNAGGKALYYINFSGDQVRQIAYVGTANRSPNASAVASPNYGDLPLAVSFDGSESHDVDGDPLTYDWDFGDGTAHATTATAKHTYTMAKTYTATLRVTDSHGASDMATVRIDAGNNPPVLTISSPGATNRFRVGQRITLRGSATDPEEGQLPDSALRWTVVKHHSTHVHPFLPPTSGNNVPITAPAPEDLDSTTNSYLEIRFTATDSKGLTSSVSQALRPHRVNVTFATEPSGLELAVNGTAITGPTTLVSWEAWVLSVSAPSKQTDSSGRVWIFGGWSDAGAATHTITTPASAATYTATFKPTCHGLPATGGPTAGDDVIVGTAGSDTIDGGGGNDTICGGRGSDTLRGGAGNDALYGEAGSDSLAGGDGNDTLDGGSAADALSGGLGRDTATYASRTAAVTVDIDGVSDDGSSADGPAGARDNVMGNVENLTGGAGADTLIGGGAANKLTGGLGADILRGLDGNDNLLANDGVPDVEISCDGGASPGAADSAHVDAGDPATTGCESVGP